MHRHFHRIVILSSAFLLTAVAGCADERDAPEPLFETTSSQSLTDGPCGIGGQVLAIQTLTAASIPSLSGLERGQIIAAVQESAHTDVTTVEEAFARVDEHEINRIILHDTAAGQFYTELEFGAGGNSYGAIFYFNTVAKAAAIHDGFQEECGPVVFNYDVYDTAPQCAGVLVYSNNATLAALDAYLPSNVAQAIVTARAAHPFESVASVFAVNGVGEARLQQILAAARTDGRVDADCSGLYDQVALSEGEAETTLEYVNEESEADLRDLLSFLPTQTTANNLIAGRRFATIRDVSNVSGVGTVVFRTLRNAAFGIL